MSPSLPPLLRDAFPFYFATDGEGTVVEFGRSLPKIVPGCQPGARADAWFVWESRAPDDAGKPAAGELTILRARHSGVLLRGHLATQDGLRVFLGSPWLRDPADLEAFGLQISDFAASDPVIDLLHVSQTQKVAVEELKALAATLQRQRTELREANARLKQRETEARKLALVASRTDNAVVITDADGRVEWVNESFERLTGYTLADVAGRKPGSLLQGPDTDPAAVQKIREHLARREGFDVEILNYSRSGKPYWVAIESRAIFDEAGALQGFMAIQTDITVRREMVERIEQNSARLEAAIADLSTQKARLDTLIENLEGGVLVEDTEGRIALINATFGEIFGIPVEVLESGALIGQVCAPLAGQAAALFVDPAEFLAGVERLVQGRKPESGRVFELKDGRFLQRDFVPITLGETSYGFLWHYHDVTRERRNLRILEALARMSEMLLRNRLDEFTWTEALGILAAAIGAERAAALEFANGDGPATVQSEWFPGERPEGTSSFHLSAEWRDALARGEVVTEEQWFKPADTREGQPPESLIIVPVRVKGRCWGCLKFARRSGSFLIKRSAMALLRSAATEVGLRLELQTDEDELKTARTDAESANRAKSAFLAAMSHEIRTPLNAVVGMSSLLLDSPLDDQQRTLARTVVGASETLLELINGILDYSKIESGRVELDLAPFELRETVLEAMELFIQAAAKKHIELSYFVDPALPDFFLGDRVRLKQVLLNLLANAFKFTEVGEIAVTIEGESASAGDWQLRVAVRDSGIGISEDALPRLFQPFSQVHTSGAENYGGTGLGLAISRRLVEAMGGTISARSEPGQGSEFHFTIPLTETTDPNASTSLGELETIRGLRLLVVDDSQTNLELLAAVAREWNLEIRLAGSPEEGLKAVQRGEQFDAALLDFHMPGMDGPDLAKAIREVPGQSDLPLVLLGSSFQAAAHDRELFRNFLMKPLRLASLRHVLARIARTGKAADPPAAKPVDRPLAALSLLVAEDNVNNQMMMRLMLGRFGCKADFVTNGREAVEAIGQKEFDAAILDLQMPVMDGLTAARTLCESTPAWRRPLLVALTANAFEDDRQACLAAGFDVYLSKPVTADQLKKTLTEALARRAQPGELP